METLKLQGRVVWTGPMVKIEKVDKETGEITTYQKAEFLVEYMEGNKKFPAGFISWNQNARIVSRLIAGDLVSVKFRPESKNKEGRIFTSLTAWSIYIHFNQFNSEPVETLPTVQDLDHDTKS